MSEYKEYVTSVNKIFDYISKMKAGWSSQDNINYIENIEEYKSVVANSVNLFKKDEEPKQQDQAPVQESSTQSEGEQVTRLEALGND